MADTTALKNRIRAAIKANDNQEITGPILQQALLDMVDELNGATETEAEARQNADGTLQGNIESEASTRSDADTELGNRITALQGVVNGIVDNVENGYVYAGIATPSTTPASGKVFYLVLTAGTYTNFGSIIVPQGINILKYNGSAWSLDSFLGLDDEPTAGSKNLVESEAVFNATNKVVQETPNHTYSKSYLNNDGTRSTAAGSNWGVYSFYIAEGKDYYASGYVRQNHCGVYYYDASGTPISGEQFAGDTAYGFTDYKLTIPVNAKIVQIAYNTNYQSVSLVSAVSVVDAIERETTRATVVETSISDKVKAILGSGIENKMDGVARNVGGIRIKDGISDNDTYRYTDPFNVLVGDCLVILSNNDTPSGIVPVSSVSGEGTEQSPYVYTPLVTPTRKYTFVVYRFTADATVAVSYRYQGGFFAGVFNSAILKYITVNRDNIKALEETITNINTVISGIDNEVNGELIRPYVDKSEGITYSDSKSFKADSETGVISVVTDSGYVVSSAIDVLAGDRIDVTTSAFPSGNRIPLVKIVEVEGVTTYEDLGLSGQSTIYNWSYDVEEDMTVRVCTKTSHTLKVYTPEIRGEKSIVNDIKELQEEVSELESGENISDIVFRKTAKNATSIAVSSNSTFTVGNPVIRTGSIGNSVRCIKVSKGEVISLSVPANESHVTFNIGFSVELPEVGTTVTNVHSYSDGNAADVLYIAPSDGYIVYVMYYTRSIILKYAEIKNDNFSYTKYLHKLASLKRGPAREEATSEAHPCFSLLIAGDPHGGTANMARFVDFQKKYDSYISDSIVVGDIVSASYGAAGSHVVFNTIDGFEKTLLVIGNHDVYNYDNQAPESAGYGNPAYWATNAQKYTKYLENVSSWNVQSPGANKCYFYKDYDCGNAIDVTPATAVKVRLIVLDMWQKDSEDIAGQLTWLQNTLTDAKTNGYSVMIAAHWLPYMANGSYDIFNCGWSEDNEFGFDNQLTAGYEYYEAVQDFIDGGGKFACWLVGHRHQYTVGVIHDYPKQMFIVVGSANYDNNRNKLVVNMPYDESYDNLCVLSIDPHKQFVRLLKVGTEFDRNLKHRGNIILDYGNSNPRVKYEY